MLFYPQFITFHHGRQPLIPVLNQHKAVISS